MRFFSIVAMFKNESSILKSWLDHYIKEGADHFYLIDNGSTDDFKDVLKQYQNKITLFSDDLTPTDFNNLKDEIKQKFQNKQNYLYNKYFLDLIKKECEYVLLCDIDEYLYTKSNKTNIKSYLVNNYLEFGVNIRWKNFGTISDCIPKNLIHINRRCKLNYVIPSNDNPKGYSKSLYNTKHLVQIDTHQPKFINFSTEILDNNHELQLNHYKIISKEYFEKIKSQRGGGNGYSSYPYSMEYFNSVKDLYNEEEDNELLNKIY